MMDQENIREDLPEGQSAEPAEGAPCAACGSCEGCEGCPAAELKDAPPVTVADVSFRGGDKAYWFDPGALTLKEGDHVIIDTARGQEFGTVSAGNHEVPAADVVLPLRAVLRIATEKDESINEENRKYEKEAFAVCRKKIEEHGLEMQLVSAERAFDGSKLLFFFTADGRIDFRELVKDLASCLHSRIELRQIGVRDKAKMVGGLGICGRPFCCRDFLEDFEPVSIKMAKTQNLSLNPTKISGTCGRLMCCLKYEQEAYEDLLQTTPKAESFVDTPEGRGTVTDVNLLSGTVRVRLEKEPDRFVTCKIDEIYVIRNGKAKKTDPPIPEDFAPISSKPRRRAKMTEAEPEQEFVWADEVLKDPEEAGRDAAEAPADAAEKKPRGRGRRSGRRGGKKPEQAAPKPPAEKEPPQSGAAPKDAAAKPHRRRRPRRRSPGDHTHQE